VADDASALTASAPHNAAQEALLDAVVDMVQKQPESLSVFTSGASFISGVVDKVKAAEVSKVVDAAAGTSGAAPKMDKAAAELLRPMLRQWLSDNMPRIVEEALRSELMSSQPGDGKGSKG
jgi:cell pole-organizing protein PopZ